MQSLVRPFVSLFAFVSLAACGGHVGEEGGGSAGGGSGGSAAGGGFSGGGSATGGATAGTAGAPEYPPNWGYELVEGCERVEHPGRAVLTLFDDPAVPFIPQHISGDGQVAAGLVGELTGSWRETTGVVPYDADFRGNVHQLDCAGQYAIFYDLQNRGAVYVPGVGISLMLGSVPSHLLPMTLAQSGGTVLLNYIDNELSTLQPYEWYGNDLRGLDDYRNAVLYSVDRDGYYLGVDALRVFYNRPYDRGQDIALVSETGPIPRVVVSGNQAVLASSLANGSVLWGPIRPADPRRQRQVIGYGGTKPLALSGGGRVVLLSDLPQQIWIEESYFTAEGGFRDLNDLAAEHGADLAGERLVAVDMSQDAQAFVGYTTRAGKTIGFHLTLPREAYPAY